ncbi:MAG TPA: iron ABC transporter permease [Prolixibacteraceae bacterium]|nr:iron ABC transporter permease [Prolixibacteraceae bacterium]
MIKEAKISDFYFQFRSGTGFILLFLVLLLFFIFDLLVGSVPISLNQSFAALFHPTSADPQIAAILFHFRIPKAITAVVAGAALSVAGLQMQTVFRNPIAGPDILGVSSGASLGVALFVLSAGWIFKGMPLFSFASSWGIVMAAWIGAGCMMFLIVLIASRLRDLMTVLIMGILISGAILAVVNVLQYFSSESSLKSFIVWTMGSLGSTTRDQLWVLVPSVAAGLLVAFISSKFLDAFLLGENYAKSMGMNLRTAYMLTFASTSILAGSITAFCGPIAFVGIIVPHLARKLFHTSLHSRLIPGTMLLGAIVMLIGDLISQLPGYEATLPINSVTSLLGIPVIIWIIFHNKKIGAL